MRAENERLARELEASRTRDADKDAPAVKADGKPTLKQFLESGKFKTYEDAQDAFQDARDEWSRKQWESEQTSRSAQDEAKRVQADYQKDAAAFQKANEDYPDMFEEVQGRLDSQDGKGTPLTTAILKSKNTPALI